MRCEGDFKIDSFGGITHQSSLSTLSLLKLLEICFLEAPYNYVPQNICISKLGVQLEKESMIFFHFRLVKIIKKLKSILKGKIHQSSDTIFMCVMVYLSKSPHQGQLINTLLCFCLLGRLNWFFTCKFFHTKQLFAEFSLVSDFFRSKKGKIQSYVLLFFNEKYQFI